MDDTDLAILREMLLDRVFRIGGADPRVSAREIARALALSHTTVANRIQAWQREGSFRGFAALPNPEILGLTVTGQMIESASPTARDLVREAIPTIEGVFFAYEQWAGSVWLAYVGQDARVAENGARKLACIPNLQMEVDQHPFPMPACGLRLSALDWRVVRAFYHNPSLPPPEMARKLGISSRSLQRHFDRLIDHHAVLYFPLIDFSRTSGVIADFDVLLRSPSMAPSVWSSIHDLGHVIIPLARWGGENLVWDLTPESPQFVNFLSFFVALESPASAERIVSRLERAPGVRKASAIFPSRMLTFPTSFDQFLGEAPRPNGPPASSSHRI